MAYGIEIISPQGNKFTIPDSNPYTFYRRFRVSNHDGLVNTGIPTDVQVMTFFRLADGQILIIGGASQVPHNGTWHILVTSVFFDNIVDAYVFANREYNNVSPSSSYGFQIFDESGSLVIGNNSRPLKMYATPFVESTNPNDPVTHIGYPAAVSASFTRCYQGSSQGGAITYGYALGGIGASDGYSTHSKEIGYPSQWIPYPSTNYPQYILTINVNEYQ